MLRGLLKQDLVRKSKNLVEIFRRIPKIAQNCRIRND